MWNVIVTGPNFPAIHRTISEGMTFILGRAEDNDVVLTDDRVSRRHIQLTATESGVRIADLNSRHGTLLNGRSLGRLARPFFSGDVATVGDCVIRVEERDPGRKGWVTSGPANPESFVTLMSSRFLSDAPVDPEPRVVSTLHALTQSAGLRGMFERILETAVVITGFQDGLWLSTDDGKTFHCALSAQACSGEPAWSATLIHRAIQSHSTLLFHHLPTDPKFQTQSILLSRALHVICAPLVVKGVVLGALYLSTRSAEVPAQAVVDFVAMLTQLAGAVADPECRPWERPTKQAHFLKATLTELSQVLAQDCAMFRRESLPAEQMSARLNGMMEAAQALSSQFSTEASEHVPLSTGSEVLSSEEW